MLQDIKKITSVILGQVISENLTVKSKHNLYDIYRSLQKMTSDIDLVAEHYLVLDFTENFLQNSSFGEPSDKWRWGLNKDLEYLNNSTKKYLSNLYYLAVDDGKEYPMNSSFISKLYNAKILYSFINTEYNVGFVKPCGFELISTILTTEFDEESLYISKFKKIDLSTYEDRVKLQKILREKKEFFKTMQENLKEYILKNILFDEIL